jgi:methylthioribulose-1-phosphate dehydratase
MFELIPAWAANAIIGAGQRMHANGWVPATAGNISVRLPDGRIAITSSGNHKGYLTAADVMAVDHVGRALTPDLRPSAETLLHCQIYQRFPGTNAVVHGHSIAGTVLSMATAGAAISFTDYELLKAFEGQSTHATTLDLPLVDNDQDMKRLAHVLDPILAACRIGYLIRGHGIYIWGPDMPAALARLEGAEFLLACELERRKLLR